MGADRGVGAVQTDREAMSASIDRPSRMPLHCTTNPLQIHMSVPCFGSVAIQEKECQEMAALAMSGMSGGLLSGGARNVRRNVRR